MALIQCMLRKQPTIKTSIFGDNFVATKHEMEIISGLRYKLKMMGIPLSRPLLIYGDSMSVIYNIQ